MHARTTIILNNYCLRCASQCRLLFASGRWARTEGVLATGSVFAYGGLIARLPNLQRLLTHWSHVLSSVEPLAGGSAQITHRPSSCSRCRMQDFQPKSRNPALTRRPTHDFVRTRARHVLVSHHFNNKYHHSREIFRPGKKGDFFSGGMLRKKTDCPRRSIDLGQQNRRSNEGSEWKCDQFPDVVWDIRQNMRCKRIVSMDVDFHSRSSK